MVRLVSMAVLCVIIGLMSGCMASGQEKVVLVPTGEEIVMPQAFAYCLESPEDEWCYDGY